MNEFLRRLDEPPLRQSYAGLERRWNDRAAVLNRRLAEEALPVRVANLVSIWTVCYTTPSRYNWLFQYYLRAAGLALSWVGTGRLVFSHNYGDDDFAAVSDRFVEAARAMHADGWWAGTLDNAAINRRILGEMLRARMRRPSAPAHRTGSVTIGSNSSPRHTWIGDRW